MTKKEAEKIADAAERAATRTWRRPDKNFDDVMAAMRLAIIKALE